MTLPSNLNVYISASLFVVGAYLFALYAGLIVFTFRDAHARSRDLLAPIMATLLVARVHAAWIGRLSAAAPPARHWLSSMIATWRKSRFSKISRIGVPAPNASGACRLTLSFAPTAMRPCTRIAPSATICSTRCGICAPTVAPPSSLLSRWRRQASRPAKQRKPELAHDLGPDTHCLESLYHLFLSLFRHKALGCVQSRPQQAT